jgi:integrase
VFHEAYDRRAMPAPDLSPSGHVYRHDGRRRPVWRALYRLPDGRRVHRTIGPAWTGRGRPPAGHFTKRTAEDWLRDVLDQARRGTLPGMVLTGITFAQAAEEYMVHKEQDRRLKPTTLRDYRSAMRFHLLPAFGELALEDITTPMVERWKRELVMSNATKIKLLTVLYGVMERARRRHGLPVNPVRDVEKPRREHTQGDELQFYSPEEVMALVRAAETEQDAAIFLTAAFTGLRRGEIVALRWRDVDFAGALIRVSASYSEGHLTKPKSDKVRSVPMAPEAAAELARLSQRERWTGDDDLVFPGVTGGFLDGSALYRRYVAATRRAGLRRLRFHDLRHTFGTTMASNPRVDMRRLQEWMGHADITTTLRYSHFRPRHDDAALVAEAFSLSAAPERPAERSTH